MAKRILKSLLYLAIMIPLLALYLPLLLVAALVEGLWSWALLARWTLAPR